MGQIVVKKMKKGPKRKPKISKLIARPIPVWDLNPK
jgi:hypothetical protein